MQPKNHVNLTSCIDVLKSPLLDVFVTRGEDVRVSSYFDIQNTSEYHVKLVCTYNQTIMSL